jgi:metallo-beta-lactamase family protein
MKLNFLGACEQVTGSSTLIEYNDIQILVDFGLNQGEEPISDLSPFDFIDFSKLKAVFLTHAHLDHCGLLPMLYLKGYQGLVYSTKATSQLVPHILRDCAQLGAPFSKDDVDLIRWHCPDMSSNFEWQKSIPFLSDGLSYYFQPTGHIVGAVSIGFLKDTPKNSPFEVLFSGDLGYNYPDQTSSLLNSETMLPRDTVTHVICESTYGDRPRDPKTKLFDNRIAMLKAVLEQTVLSQHCRLLIPAFSLHRTQEIILDIYIAMMQSELSMHGVVRSKYEMNINTTLGDNISEVYSKRLTDHIGSTFGDYKNINPKVLKYLGMNEKLLHHFLSNLYRYGERTAKTNKKNQRLFEFRCFENEHANIRGWQNRAPETMRMPTNKSQLVVASSGMMSDGPIKTWMKAVLDDEQTFIAITGYQAPGTIGQKLIRMIEQDQDDFISLGDRLYTKEDIKCRLVHLNGYSGHADQEDLVRWITGNLPSGQTRQVILNHGTNEMRESLKKRLESGRELLTITIPKRKRPSFDI